MLFCRFFEMDKSGHILGVQTEECGDEDEVHLAASRMLSTGNGQVHGIEAWFGARKIAFVTRE